MPIQVERSVDDPIVSIVFEGIIDAETVQDVKTQLAQLLKEMGMFYAVIDLRGTEITFGEALALLENPAVPVLSASKRVRPVFIGRSVPRDTMNLQEVPVFTDKDAAFEYIRREIAANTPGQ